MRRRECGRRCLRWWSSVPFHDLNNTDADDLPEHLQSDPYCVWVWIVAPETDYASVCFEKDMAERVAELKTGDVGMKRTRLWFSSDVAEKEVHAVPGSGYSQ